MSTAEMTVRERVEQAVARQFELIAERVELQKVVVASNAAKNILRANPPEARKEEFAVALTESKQKAVDVYAKQEAVVARPLARAQGIYDEKELVIRAGRDEELEKLEAYYQKLVEDTQRDHELDMASAEAEIYRAEQEVRAMNDTLNQHAAQIKEIFGIDLKELAK